MSTPLPIQLGLCCLNTKLRQQRPSIFPSRTMRLKTLRVKGDQEAKDRALANLMDIERMIHWNQQNDIHVFRLSSNIFPHFSNPEVTFYGFDFAKQHLKRVGDLANKYGQRLTFHPGQFNVIGTPHPHILNKTVTELNRHAEILDLMGQGPNGVMVIHGGGHYGDKEATKKRWVQNFGRLSESAAHRLVLEHCERCFNLRDCLEVSSMVEEEYGIALPVVIDSHHYTCYSLLHPDDTQEPIRDMIPEVLETWRRRGIKPKCHVSEQGSGRIGHHSDFIQEIPDYLLEIPSKYGVHIDIMIEAKLKEQAIQQLYNKYPQLCSGTKDK